MRVAEQQKRERTKQCKR